MTAILGISAFYHDSAAALVVDGRIVAAAQEERFTRIKHDPAFPGAGDRVLPAARPGCRPSDLDYVAFYDKPLTKFERLLETYLAYAPAGFRSFRLAMPLWLKDKLHMRRTLRRGLGGPTRARLVFTDHHESHAASAFFPSPFDEAAILTLDGVGEWTTATFGVGEGNRIRLIDHIAVPALAGPALLGVHLLLRLQGQQRRIQADGPGPLRPARSTRPDPQAPDRPEARRQLLAGHGLFQLLPGADDDQSTGSTGSSAGRRGRPSRRSSSGTWTWPPASRR